MPLKPCRILLKVFYAIGVIPNFVIFEKAIQFITGLEAEKQTGLVCRKRTRSIALDGECFQSFARRGSVPCQVVRELNSDLHGFKSTKKQWRSTGYRIRVNRQIYR